VSIFQKQVFKNIKTIGAIAPSSSYLARRMAKHIATTKTDITVIEYGPGTGVVTKAILERLSPKSRLIAIEVQPELAQQLCDTYDDPRLQVLVADAETAHIKLAQLGITKADYIISSLPFGNFSPETIANILTGMNSLLKRSGTYVQFQYIPWRLHAIKDFFEIESISFEIRNLPPAFVIVGSKKI
jgi:phospholipid N-methyltransferase